jgi:hypothetical protein
MAKTTWGRRETIIWPRHMPIYTYGLAFAIAVSYPSGQAHPFARAMCVLNLVHE